MSLVYPAGSLFLCVLLIHDFSFFVALISKVQPRQSAQDTVANVLCNYTGAFVIRSLLNEYIVSISSESGTASSISTTVRLAQMLKLSQFFLITKSEKWSLLFSTSPSPFLLPSRRLKRIRW